MELKRKKNIQKILKIFTFVLIILLLSSCNQKTKIVSLKIGTGKINAELATTMVERIRGLSNRKKLCNDCGMLFIHQRQSKHNYWMKDMNFPLDIIYIRDKQIVEVFKDVAIFNDEHKFTVISPQEKADKVLELNAGWCDKHKVRVGDRIEL